MTVSQKETLMRWSVMVILIFAVALISIPIGYMLINELASLAIGRPTEIVFAK